MQQEKILYRVCLWAVTPNVSIYMYYQEMYMKKLVSGMSLFLFMFAAAVSQAADGEAMYKSSCASCHGPQGEKGNAPLKDQATDAIFTKLKGYVDGSYGGEKKTVMQNVVKKHSEEELKAMADYIGKK